MLKPCMTEKCSKLYSSEIITGVSSEHTLDIDSTNFNTALSSKLYCSIPMQSPDSILRSQAYRSWSQGSYTTYVNGLITDGWKFRGKQLAKTIPPKNDYSCKVSLYLIPECSAYVGGYCAIAIDVFLDTYKLLGGRQFCTDNSLFWVKGDTTKVGMQLQVSNPTVLCIVQTWIYIT